MAEAVIVATARTPIGKAYRGAFHDTQGQALAGHAIGEAVRRAGDAGDAGSRRCPTITRCSQGPSARATTSRPVAWSSSPSARRLPLVLFAESGGGRPGDTDGGGLSACSNTSPD